MSHVTPRDFACKMIDAGKAKVFMSTSVSGKVIAMWMPILVLFDMGFEHSIVNMFLFPAGLLPGGNFTIADYLIWNEIPTVPGNMAGGLTLMGAMTHSTHYRTAPETRRTRKAPASLARPIPAE
ncbi:formate/nitrite transporter family protein [Paracoccus sp. (in: a-proteobacteria)]|uniref:formate/nitrite transporter family protein n=1 Tax=Paracoccus sp. TaxID=267 RepID=UPI003A858C53